MKVTKENLDKATAYLKESGGPAFPFKLEVEGDAEGTTKCSSFRGMSLRDYFAAAALQGLLSDHTMNEDLNWYAKHAHEIADAMLAEREKRS